MSPDVRDNIKKYLTVSIRTFLAELAGRYFRQPETAEARQLLLEANADALHELTQNEPHAAGTIQTFAAELLDKEHK
jgi:hypothetical protein